MATDINHFRRFAYQAKTQRSDLSKGQSSEKLFLEVNGILKSLHNQTKKYMQDDENLPLKGFVSSMTHEVPITGYLVKKKGLYYYKTNLVGACENTSAKKMHEQFSHVLKHFQLQDSSLKVGLKEALIVLFCEMEKETMEVAAELEKKFNELQISNH